MSAPDLNPYIGPRPFEREEGDRFFGRDRETPELVSTIVAHEVVIFYARSGAGKTSLLNARVVPLLEQKGYDVLPVGRVQGRASAGWVGDEIDNLYVFNLLLSLAGPDADPVRLAGQSLSDFLGDLPHFDDHYGLPAPRVLFLDQFEELFTAFPAHWQQRAAFFEQVRAALAADPLLRVVFSLREDYLAPLDGYRQRLPAGKVARYRLERMRPEAARAAIEGPLAGRRRQFAPPAAEQLVDDLRRERVESAGGAVQVVEGEFVEPVQLQVVCQNLWRELPAEVSLIAQEHVAAYGDVGEALAQFYGRALAATVQQSGVSERQLRRWFSERLITPAGTRGTVYRGPEETGGLPNKAVEELDRQRIIRPERRAGALWYELTHDRLVDPIVQENARYELRRQARTRQIVVAAAVVALLFLASLYAVLAQRRLAAVLARQLAQQQSLEATAEALEIMTATAAARAAAAAQATATVEARVTATAAARATSVAQATGAAVAFATSQAAFAHVNSALVAYNDIQATPDADEAEEAAALAALQDAQAAAHAISFQQAETPAGRALALGSLFTVDPATGDPYEQQASSLFAELPPAERLMVLDALFGTEYRRYDRLDQAGWRLFYALPPAEQQRTFAALPDATSPQALATVTAAVASVLGTRPDGAEQALMRAMLAALERVEGSETEAAALFLAPWLEGREQAAAGDDAAAVAAFDRAISHLPELPQPLLFLDRGRARARLDVAPEEALADLTHVLEVAQEAGPSLFLAGEELVAANTMPAVVLAVLRANDALLEASAGLETEYPALGRLSGFQFVVWPTEELKITQGYNENPGYFQSWGLTGHEGVDFAAPEGSEVFVVAPGRVYHVVLEEEGRPYGNAVYVQHADGFRTAYAHLSRIDVELGDELAGGQQIGLAGSSGNSHGGFLHLTLYHDGATERGETRQPGDIVDPSPYMASLLAEQVEAAVP